jgi:hypothetical protein
MGLTFALWSCPQDSKRKPRQKRIEWKLHTEIWSGDESLKCPRLASTYWQKLILIFVSTTSPDTSWSDFNFHRCQDVFIPQGSNYPLNILLVCFMIDWSIAGLSLSPVYLSNMLSFGTSRLVEYTSYSTNQLLGFYRDSKSRLCAQYPSRGN